MEYILDNKDTEQKTFHYVLSYKTGEEMLALKDDLFQMRERILAANPNMQEEYEKRAAYSKYSISHLTLEAIFPSLVRYVSFGWKKPRMYRQVPKIVEKYQEDYKEYVYDVDDNLLMIKTISVRHQETKEILYLLDFDGYRYVFNIDRFSEDISDHNASCYVSRIKYENDKLIQYEEYARWYLSHGIYYSEIYYTVDGKDYCTAQILADDNVPESCRLSKPENIKPENINLPVTEKLSPVDTLVYKLIYNNCKLEQIDEMSLKEWQYKTIFPKKSKATTGLPKTKRTKTDFKQMLKENGCTTKNKIAFSAFWDTFKSFALECKYDCSADDLLWEPDPIHNSIHIARQFCHEDNSGNYDYMEQLYMDIDMKFNQSFDGEKIESFWSDNDFKEFFSKVEQTKEFKSIPSDAIIELCIVFCEV